MAWNDGKKTGRPKKTGKPRQEKPRAKEKHHRTGFTRKLRGFALGPLLRKGLKPLKPYQRLLFLSLITGLGTAAMALILKFLVRRFELLLLDFNIDLAMGSLNLNLFTILSPALGIGLTLILVKRLVKADLSHGVSSVLRSIAVGEARMPPWSSWAYVVACSLTSGFGGSVGMEAPMLATGAGLGSNLGRLGGSAYRERVVLMACGAAAAVAAIFKAPIAGLVIALEVLAMDSAASAILPVIIAAASGAVLSMLFTDQSMAFSFAIHERFRYENIPWYLVLGVICGLVSVFFTRTSYFFEARFKNLSVPARFLLGSGLVGLLVFFFPPLFGEGYEAMKFLLGGKQPQLVDHSIWASILQAPGLLDKKGQEIMLLALMAGMVLLKSVASALTLGAGGVGGIFAPSLLMGCLTGYVFSHAVNLGGMFYLPESNFALVGMAAVLGGVMHAPLSGIFLIAEITGGYALFVPLMICVVASVFTVKRFETHSIYTKKLARDGELIDHGKDRSALDLLELGSFIHRENLEEKTDQTSMDIRSLLASSPMAIREDMEPREILDLFLPESDSAQDEKDSSERISPPGPGSFDPGQAEDGGPAGPGTKEPGSRPPPPPALPPYLPVLDAEGRYAGYVSLAEILAAYRRNIVRMGARDEAETDDPVFPPR